MKCLTLKADNRMDYTTVSNIFIDNYMPQANGEFVKVYLYLLRCMSDPDMDISISSIADRFDHTEKDVIRALRYFAGKGLISIEYGEDDELSAVTFLPFNSEFTIIKKNVSAGNQYKPAEAHEDTVADEDNPLPKKPSYSVTQLKAFTANEDISQLMYITQKYLGKTLTAGETNTILYLYDSLHFSAELIEYLIEYCVTNNHKSMRYIESIALSWASEGIDTIQKAKENICSYNSRYYSVFKAFGITGRNPVEYEKAFIDKWHNDYCYDNDIILEACSRTIKAVHNPSFEYADRILKSWKEHNVISLSDVAALDKADKPVRFFNNSQSKAAKKPQAQNNKFNDFPQRTYDFDLLEKRAMEEFERKAMEE